MKKLLFLIMLTFAGFQLNAADYTNVNYIEKYGDLKLNGKQLSAENGTAVQLRGWSTFGLQWQVSCYTKTNWAQMKAWGANIIRLAMYVYEGGAQNDMDGYISKMKNYIDWCNEVGIYCLVDWHVLTPGNPNQYLNNSMGGKGAEYFFDQITSYVKQNGYIHVLYEICNEPNGCSWNDIKNYANTVLPHISQNDPGAIVVVGTPQWDQLIDQAASNPISYNGLNLMYAFHYYSCSHTQFLPKLKSAAGTIPVFVSEWGPVNFDGDMSKDSSGEYIICTNESNQLMQVCDGDNNGNVKISWCSWQWGDKDEGSSALKSCGNVNEAGLQSAGKYVLSKLCGDGDCVTIVTTDGPFGGDAQKIPNDLFQIAYYDLGGEGVAYHDGNGTGFEILGLPENEGKSSATGSDGETYNRSEVCKTDNNGNICHCNAGYKYASEKWGFRENECVDVNTCYGVAGDYASYNLGNRENDEWLVYTVDVKEAGYYEIEYQANKATSGTVAFTVKKDGKSKGNAVYNYKTEEEFTGTLSLTAMTDCNESGDWLCWEWNEFVTKGDKNPAILFKEDGLLQLEMSFPTEGGDLGPFKFTKVKSYTGEGYPEDNTSTEEVAAGSFSIYPNPTNGAFSIALNGVDVADVTIVNMVGQTVFSGVIDANAEINAGLATGTYIVIVKSDNGVFQQKLVVK